MVRKLFLLGGGNKILDIVSREFIDAAGPEPELALLLQGGPKWEVYLPQYVGPWARQGVRHYHLLVPDARGKLDVEAALAVLRSATGIFIGGGNTEIYRRLYAIEPIGAVIRERYQEGVPVAGLSAGSILASNISWLLPEESESSSVEVVQGLGLIKDVVIGAHFSEWNTLPQVLEAMSKARVNLGLGIDEEACAVLENEQIKRVLGHSVYQIEMTDFETQSFVMKEVVLSSNSA